MQNTIAGLTMAIGSLQQEYLNMYTRQHNEHTRSCPHYKPLKDSNHIPRPSQASASSICNGSSAPPTMNNSSEVHSRPCGDTELMSKCSWSLGEAQTGAT